MSEITGTIERASCPLCGEDATLRLSDVVRGGLPFPCGACEQCGTAYLTRRLDSAALGQLHSLEFGAKATLTPFPTIGAALPKTDPKYAPTLAAWWAARARNAATLGLIQPLDRVFEIGAGGGETLSLLRQEFGVVPNGSESLEERVAEALSDGIPLLQCAFDAPRFDAEPSDVVLSFHMLQKLSNPLAVLTAAWTHLNPGGRIVLEVPNLLQPTGPLESFFNASDLHYFTESTLSALLRRANFQVERTVSSLTLFAVGRKPVKNVLPKEPAAVSRLLSSPEQNAAWVQAHLSGYDRLLRLRQKIRDEGPDMGLLQTLVCQLARPALPWHVIDTVLSLVEFFMSHQAVGLACLVSSAAATGPYDAELLALLQRLSDILRRDGITAAGLSQEPSTEAPTRTLARETRQPGRELTAPSRDSRSDPCYTPDLRAALADLRSQGLPPIGFSFTGTSTLSPSVGAA